MLPKDRPRFGPVAATLKHGRQITVRLLGLTDGEALGEFYESVPREDYRFYAPHPLTRQAALNKVRDGADSPTFVCVVGINPENRLIGYAWYHWQEQDSPSSCFGICIHREYQNSGTGQALMLRLFDIAREIGPPKMRLTVQKANGRAVALYQKMGFTILREQTRDAFEEFPIQPEYLMERNAC